MQSVQKRPFFARQFQEEERVHFPASAISSRNSIAKHSATKKRLKASIADDHDRNNNSKYQTHDVHDGGTDDLD